MQGNAVHVPPVIEIQRPNTSNFIKVLGGPQSHILGGPELMYSSLTYDFYCASAVSTLMRDIDITVLFVCNVPVLYENGLTYRYSHSFFFTVL